LSCLCCLSVCNVGVLWPNRWMDQDGTWHAGRPRPWPHCVRCGPSSPSPKRRRIAPHFWVHVYCGQTAGWIKMALGTEVGLGPVDFVRWGPTPVRTERLIIRPCLLWPKGWMDEDGTCMEVGLGPGHILLDGYPAPHPKKADRAPNFRPISISINQSFNSGNKAHKTSRCIKMTLRMEVGLGPGDFVLDGDPAHPPQKGSRAPNFQPMAIVAKRLDALRCQLVCR